MSRRLNRCRECRQQFETIGPGRCKCPSCGHEWTEPETSTDRAIAWLESICAMLREKGAAYGNSIDEPVRIFNKAGAADGLAVRIDDKLARIRAGRAGDTEDSVKDLVGYIALWSAQ